MSTPQLCLIDHRSDPERPRTALDGLLVCRGCAHRIYDQLQQLPQLREELTDALAVAWRESTTDATWSLAIAEKALPLQPDVADHRSEMDSVLASLARMLAEDLDAERAAFDGIGPTAPPVAWPPYGTERSAPWLQQRIYFALAQPWVAELSDQLGELVHASRAFLDPRGIKRVPCGPCPAHVSGPALPEEPWPIPCGGVLIACVGKEPTDRTDPTCGTCGHVVTLDYAAALKRGLTELVDTVTAAEQSGTPAGTIRYWASSGRLRRQGIDAQGRTLYVLAHVHALKNQRQAEMSRGS